MALDVQKPSGRRLRVRVDMYKKHPNRRFEPVKRQALVLTVADRSEHRAMFRGLVKYLTNESWKSDVRPEDAAEGDE